MLNPNIILQGQQLNAIGALSAGQQAGQMQRMTGERNAMQDFMMGNGAQIRAGDEGALNALSNFGLDGLNAAQGVESNRLGMDNTRSTMQDREARLRMAQDQARQQAQTHAANMSAADRAAEAAALERGLAMGTQAQSPEQWDQVMQSLGLSDMVGQFDNKDMIIAGALGVKDALAMGNQQGYRPATAEEAAQYGAVAGQIDTATNRFYPNNPPSGMEFSADGQGGFTMTQGAGVGGVKPGTAPQGYTVLSDPNAPGGVAMTPTPGGPVEAETQAAQERDARRRDQIARAGGTVIQDLQRALDILPELGALTGSDGVVGGIARSQSAKIPGSTVNRITQFTESALSNVGLDVLQQMRDNSPTGGALGQVPIQQQQRLEQVLGSLNVNQPPEVLEANIKRIMNIYTDIIYGGPEERALAVSEGRMSPQDNAQIDGFYYELPFDQRGRSIDADSAPTGPSDEELLQMYGGN